jgi:Fe-S-cluster containining protein
MTSPLRNPVPCQGCTACCRGELVVLFPEDGDDPARLEHVELPGGELGPLLVLKHRENGDCVYLGPQGCTIHDRAPAVCRAFDCRTYFLSMTRAERRLHEREAKRQGGDKSAIFRAGRARVHTLTMAEREAAVARRGASEAPSRQMLRKMMVAP